MLIWIVAIIAVIVLIRIFLRYNVAACTSNFTMTGKVVIVTGANSGIGFCIARDLATRGARVILACRNESRGTQARDQIIQQTGNHDVIYLNLDLASLSSVRKFSEEVIKTEKRLDVLVNNAGVYGETDRYTDDGIIVALQTNLFAPILLTDLLLPVLKKSAGRIVILSSLLHYLGHFNAEKINDIKNYRFFGKFRAYFDTKFCLVAFTMELAQRLKCSEVTVNVCHPGIVLTNITSGYFLENLFFACWCWICSRSVEEAAATPLFLCVAAEARASGGYYTDCARWQPLPSANDRTVGSSLIEVAEKLLKCKLGNMSTE